MNEKSYSPKAQALLDKMKPLADEINRLDEIERKNRIGGSYEEYRDARDEKQKLIKKIGRIQLQYRKVRAAEEGQVYLGVR